MGLLMEAAVGMDGREGRVEVVVGGETPGVLPSRMWTKTLRHLTT